MSPKSITAGAPAPVAWLPLCCPGTEPGIPPLPAVAKSGLGPGPPECTPDRPAAAPWEKPSAAAPSCSVCEEVGGKAAQSGCDLPPPGGSAGAGGCGGATRVPGVGMVITAPHFGHFARLPAVSSPVRSNFPQLLHWNSIGTIQILPRRSKLSVRRTYKTCSGVWLLLC